MTEIPRPNRHDGGMHRGLLPKIVAALLLGLLAVQGVRAGTGFTHIVYRDTAFATQRTNYLCTAAVVQNIVNIATGTSRDGKVQQLEFYAYGLQNNRYDYRNAGVDPQGVEAMLELYIPGSDWGQVVKPGMQGALKAAARAMRATDLPVVLFVGGGKHVWTMNGYSATADPASGEFFTITHVQFSGPLYPKTVALHGWFDLEPNTRRSSDRFKKVFFPYKEYLAFGDHRNTPWNGSFVAVVPLAYDPPDPEPTPDPTPTAAPTPAASSGPGQS
jgi:hypothetical protein